MIFVPKFINGSQLFMRSSNLLAKRADHLLIVLSENDINA